MTEPDKALLLVEDDPTSRAFLLGALAEAPAVALACGSCADARALAQTRPFDLWLIDAHLPDGDGLACLAGLRAIAPDVPALAVTASEDRAELAALCAGGFAEVLQKPLPAVALLAAVRRHLGIIAPPPPPPPMPTPTGKHPLWDEAQALRAVGGRPEVLTALRALFRDELPAQVQHLRSAATAQDAAAIAAIAHRLVASCGFVGAARLRESCRALQAAPLDSAVQAWCLACAADLLD